MSEPIDLPFELGLKKSRLAPLIAVAMIGAWALALGFSLFVVDWSAPHGAWGLALLAFLVLAQTHLYVGLFIVAHEAMHGLAAPGRPRLNQALGALALRLYAGFNYGRLLAAHRSHHAFPASERDPDWRESGFFVWYATFIARYFDQTNVVFFAAAFAVVLALGGSSLAFFGGLALPAILSSLQLFYFGTYLPHRRPANGYNDRRAESSDFPIWLSYLTCFHFGYHYEHHAFPWIPWWRAPAARRALLAQRKSEAAP